MLIDAYQVKKIKIKFQLTNSLMWKLNHTYSLSYESQSFHKALLYLQIGTYMPTYPAFIAVDMFSCRLDNLKFVITQC